MFNENELKILLNLLNRVTIQGNEALQVTILIQKANQLLQSKQVETDKKEIKDDVKK